MLIEPFKDYKASTTDIDVAPGYVHELRASLSQGSFLAFLRVTAPVEGAKIYVDRPPTATAPVRGCTPRSDFIDGGDHTVWIEATGFQTFEKKIDLEHGETVDVRADLTRLPFGIVRFDSVQSYFNISVDGGRTQKYDWQKGPFTVAVPRPASTRSSAPPTAGRTTTVRSRSPPARCSTCTPKFSEAMSYGPPITVAVLAALCGVGAGLAGAHSGSLPATDTDKNTFNNLMITGLVGAGLFTGGAIFFFIDFTPDFSLSLEKPKEFDADDKAKKKPGVTGFVSPFFGPNQGGFSLHAVF